jgi:DNA-binding IclR family transcriptional regulator
MQRISDNPDGAQVVRRTAQVLKCVATLNRHGAGVSQIAAATGLPLPTVHRILKALMSEALIMQQRDGRLYFLGPGLHDLGVTAGARFDFSDVYKPSVERLATETGDTVFLTKRSGDDMLCLHRETGAFPIKAFVTDVGLRRPMGVGAGGIAILASLPQPESEDVIAGNAHLYAEHGKTIEEVQDEVSSARERGYVIREIARLGITTLAVAMHDGLGRPSASLSIASISTRMSGDHRSLAARLLKQEAAALEKALAERYSI